MDSASIEQLLPEIFRRTLTPQSPLAAIVAAIEGLLSPAEQALATLPDNLAPYRASEEFVVLLAHFADLDRYLPREAYFEVDGAEVGPPLASGIGRLRELVRAAPMLSKWRGTGYGLRLFLETATGIPGFEVREAIDDAHGSVRPFHIRISAPAGSLAYRELVEQIVRQEKPAYVTYEILFQGQGNAGDGEDTPAGRSARAHRDFKS